MPADAHEAEQLRSEEYERQADAELDDRAGELEMSAADYHTLPGMSNSGLSDFIDSPLLYWHNHVQPGREAEESTPFMQFGSAVHAAVLEPGEFDRRYCAKFDAPEGCLKTVADLRGHMESLGLKAKGAAKGAIIEQVIEADPEAFIFDRLAEEYDREHVGKEQFGHDAWLNIQGCANALRDEPELQKILSDPTGKAERKFTVKHHGLMLRSMMDWTTDAVTTDIKTISRKRGEPFDRTVTLAIWREGYYRQAYFYSLVRSIAAGDDPPNAANAPEFIFAFVESSPPFETRLRKMKPKVMGTMNLLWTTAGYIVEKALESYGEYVAHFGEKQWRYAQSVEPLMDEEFPQVSY
jgi:hypothetical protein